MPVVTDLRCEYRVNPLGIDARRPRLSWRLDDDRRGARQAAYQIRVEEGESLLWDSQRVASDATAHLRYTGPALSSGQRVTWRVRVWDERDQPTDWSLPATWEMGLLEASDWRAKWIDPEGAIDPKVSQPCPCLRTTFTLNAAPVAAARAYVTAHGVYELSLNGQVVGDQLFAPGFTSYHDRLEYQTYELDGHLRPGVNAVGVMMGDGWYRGKTDALSHRNVYGQRLALLLQIHIRYQDGSEQWVISDENWRARTGPILKSDMKDGEIYDARLELTGWDTPDYDAQGWGPVRLVSFPLTNLAAAAVPPVRRQETFTPTVLRTPNGQTVLDLGQNIAGWMRLRVQGPPDTTIRLRHGETLDKDGNFSMANLGFPPIVKVLGNPEPLLQEVHYTLKGSGVEEYEPRFTFQGFRYVLVEGFPGQPTPDNFTGVALYSDMRRTGAFTCSNPLINRLQQNIEWSMKGNFLEIPTDCPQRERAGWTGDAQVFARTASFIMETAGFFSRWLRDLAADQRANGLVPNLVPDPSRYLDAGIVGATNGSSGWGDAAVIIPWTLYQCYGDRDVLEVQYRSMKSWVDYMAARAQENVHWSRRLSPHAWGGAPEHWRYIWDTNYHWGEWLEPNTVLVGELAINFILSRPWSATAYLAYSSGLLAEAARLLGRDDDAQHYADLAENVRRAWVKEFASPDGRLKPDTQAAYVRALAFDVLPADLRPAAARRLAELIRASGDHLATGFLATPFICHVLSQHGYLDVAYRILNQTTPPSWLYPVTVGATTIWEFWEVIKPDRSVTFGSLNHYSPGAVGSWLYQVVAGIEIGAPGYRHIRIQPQPGGGLTSAQASYEALPGTIRSGWRIQDGQFMLAVTIPPNTTASVRLPRAAQAEVAESGVPLGTAPGVTGVSADGDSLAVEVGAGSYQFAYAWAG